MPSREPRLLLVDDDPSAIQVMSRMLAQFPDQRFALSGEEALKLAREAPPDLILLDADMPNMSGLEVCEALKSEPALADIPVVFATSYAAPLLEVAALERGAADFVTKPLVASQLTSRVRAQLRQRAHANTDERHVDALARPCASAVPSILIVDDDISAIRVLRHTLSAMGDFHFAKCGADALKLARRLGPDLILVDAHMPEMDGYAVCEALRAERAFEQVPIVFVTRFADPGNERRAFDLGATDFIAKPFVPAVIQARVRNLINAKRRADDELRAVSDHWRSVGDARVAEIVDSASDAIVSHDDTGTVVLANAAAGRLFGVPRERLMGQTIVALLGGELHIDASLPGRQTRLSVARDDGSRVPVEAAVSCVGGGAQRLTTVVLRDMSDRERLEAESRARAEAEAANRTKTMMLSFIAHEIGNPLNALLGFAQLMAMEEASSHAPSQARRLGHVLACGKQMQALLRDLLDLGSIETGRLALSVKPFGLTQCIRASMDAVSVLAAQASVSIEHAGLSIAVGAKADPDRLQQCLVNLLTNAIKYNRAGGWLRVELDCQETQVRIAVRDNGIGMNAAQRQQLFEPFNRLGRSDGRPGTGLGLAITRQLIEAMDGQVLVDSEPGRGSCFTLVLPRAVHEETSV